MKDVMGLIFTGENDARLRELTLKRAVAAIPVAGRYRTIDFPISNLVNSGIRNVGVITQKNYHSLMDHLGSGKEWDLHGKNNGLVILPPFLTSDNVGVYSGMLDALRTNLGYLRRSRQEYIIVSTSHHVYNMDYNDLLRFHVENQSDITLLYSRDPKLHTNPEGSENGFFSVDEEGRVTGVEIDPSNPTRECNALEVYLLKRETLRYLVDQAAANGMTHFRRDIIQRLVHEGRMRIFAYEQKGRVWRIESVQSLFQLNMDLLNAKARDDLFNPDRPVYTKLRDDMPTRYVGAANVCNSLVADGCIIEGTVENSVLFRGVHVAEGAVVRDSVLMQDVQVQSSAELSHCILDKQAIVKRGGRLIAPAAYPIVIAKDVVV